MYHWNAVQGTVRQGKPLSITTVVKDRCKPSIAPWEIDGIALQHRAMSNWGAPAKTQLRAPHRRGRMKPPPLAEPRQTSIRHVLMEVMGSLAQQADGEAIIVFNPCNRST